MDPIPVDTEIKWPFKMFVGGISGSGKTIFSINFIKKIIKILSSTAHTYHLDI